MSDAWRRWRRDVDLDEYETRWDRLEASGRAVHGEADLVTSLGGDDVLDAGCGLGRVAIELARRGRRVVGVDNDGDMLARARRRPEPVRWVLADLAALDLDDRFDVVVMAGNVLNFVAPEARPDVVGALARHLRPGGRLVAGSGTVPGCGPAEVDRWADDVGLVLERALATWEGDPWAGGDYRVTIHRHP